MPAAIGESADMDNKLLVSVRNQEQWQQCDLQNASNEGK